MKNIILQNNLIDYIETGGTNDSGFFIDRFTFRSEEEAIIFKVGDNIYRIAKAEQSDFN